jgi:simple sugar transport system ATP-binding protein
MIEPTAIAVQSAKSETRDRRVDVSTATPFVELVDIWKSFGPIHALRGVSLDFMPGETFALLGDNAAGKSTLMKILTGVHQPTRGTIKVNGEPVVFERPATARARGIEMVYQDFALSENLDIRSNIFLGRERRKSYLGGLIKVLDNAAMGREAEKVIAALDLKMNPQLKVRRLSGGQRQAVAIGRALAFDAKLIIMDEPTANLAVGKVERLLDLTHRLHDLGVGVIIITHRLDEAFAVAGRFAVMRQGQVVGRFRTSDVTEREVSQLISKGVTTHQRAEEGR